MPHLVQGPSSRHHFWRTCFKCHTNSSTKFPYTIRQGLGPALRATRGSTYFQSGDTHMKRQMMHMHRYCCQEQSGEDEIVVLQWLLTYTGRARMACYVVPSCSKVHSRLWCLQYSLSSSNELLMPLSIQLHEAYSLCLASCACHKAQIMPPFLPEVNQRPY